MDTELARYLVALREGHSSLRFPDFANEARHTAPILAVLETPGRSGAESSGKCSLDNNDGTARRNKRIAIDEVGLRREDIVFWNFYACYDDKDAQGYMGVQWPQELHRLTELMDGLKVVIAFGNRAWLGMRDIILEPSVMLLSAPHPSDRRCRILIPRLKAE